MKLDRCAKHVTANKKLNKNKQPSALFNRKQQKETTD